MKNTGLGRAAFHCYPVLKVVIHRVYPFFLLWEDMVVEGGTKKRRIKTKYLTTIGSITSSLDKIKLSIT